MGTTPSGTHRWAAGQNAAAELDKIRPSRAAMRQSETGRFPMTTTQAKRQRHWAKQPSGRGTRRSSQAAEALNERQLNATTPDWRSLPPDVKKARGRQTTCLAFAR
jgi:hypothetical protein